MRRCDIHRGGSTMRTRSRRTRQCERRAIEPAGTSALPRPARLTSIEARAAHNEERPDMAESIATPARRTGAWSILWGVLLMIAGVLAIMQPVVAALAFNLLFAWLLVFSGIVEVVYAIHDRGKEGFRLKLLLGVLTLLLGIFLLVRPVAGVAGLALMIGAFVLA